MSLLRRASVVGRYPQFNNYQQPLSQLYGSTTITSAAGERIDEFTVLGLSTVLSCVSLLADSVASMPMRCFTTVNGKRVLTPVPEVLSNPDPNESNSFELLHMIVSSMALHGNAYVHIDRDRAGREIGLSPLHPYQMQVLPNGDQTGRKYLHLGNDIPSDDIMHLRWFTPPQSLVGISPIVQQRTVLGLAMAMDRHLAQWYGEGATPSSVLETDAKLTLEQARTLQNTWETTHRRHRRPAVLTEGMKWKPVQASASDQQLEQMRNQVVNDVARIFRIPPHMVGAKGDGMTYQNVEQASLDFLTNTIHPWLRRIEIGLSKILPPGTDVTFDTTALMRVDSLTRARVAAQLLTIGARTPNEVRAIDGYEPYEGGDVFNQALSGAVTAGGPVAPLGTDADSSAPVMGVLD